MRISKADRAAWRLVARSLPILMGMNGICYVLHRLFDKCEINRDQLNRMSNQLRRKYGHLDSIYYWPVGLIPPRVRACLNLARPPRKKK